MSEAVGKESLISKEAMALDALIRLNRQIAKEPDVCALVNFFLLTVVGQFSVADSFLAMPNPSELTDRPLFFATGAFVNDRELADAGFLFSLLEIFGHQPAPVVPATMSPAARQVSALKMGGASKAELLLPLVHDGKPFGVLALAGKVTKKPFTNSDIALLQGLLDAVAPFLANLGREYFDLFNSASEGVMIFDSDHRLKRINETALRLLGAASAGGAAVGNVYRMGLRDVLPDPPFREWASSILKAVATSPRGHIQNLVVTSNDVQRVYDVRVSFINCMTDKQHDLLLVVDDVTIRRDNEHRLYELQRQAEKGVLISCISHEIKNYLAILSGGAELATRYLQQQQTDKVLDKLADFTKHIDRMRDFVVGVMNSSRRECRMAETDLSAVVSDAVDFAKVQKSFRSMRVRVTSDETLPRIMADPDHLAQLLLNLLNNAAEAIQISENEYGLIDIEMRTNERGEVLLVVSDNGIGMPPDVRDKLFRLQVTTKQSGFGYGLLTCAAILREHGATVDVQSEPGVGSMITIGFATAGSNSNLSSLTEATQRCPEQ